ncbi:MAG: molecular chaperone HtpG, partial [Saprospiraceae bacterium]|nr:molecular chaperone HtpG [Saprospiraceae bacterium]
DIVPEFLTMLHGVIDSPDIPLNVSRSYLQSDQNVKKITSYITKKVAGKLDSLFKKDRKAFEEKWDQIAPIVKYGMITEEKFFDKARKFALLKNVAEESFTIDDYKTKVAELQTDKYDKVVMLYTQQDGNHDSYITEAKEKGYDVLVMDHVIDNHFMQNLEHKLENTVFVRVDSDTMDQLVQKDESSESVLSESEQEKVKSLFEEVLKESGHQVQLKPLSTEGHPVVITKPEFMRRMREMQALQGMGGADFPESSNVVINSNHPLIATKLLKMRSVDKKKDFVKYLYDLARLNQQMLTGSELTSFIDRSLEFVS